MRCHLALFLLTGVLVAQTTTPEPKGAIRGTVRDTTGAPVTGVAVAANPVASEPLIMPDGSMIVMQHPQHSHTDESGSYSLTSLAPGSYSVVPECVPAPKRVKLDTDQEATLDFVCPTNPSLSGHVVDHNGDPAVDAFVWLLKSEYQAGVLKQIVIGPKVTGEDGAYSFDKGLEPNRGYYVVVDRQTPIEVVNTATSDLTDDRDPIEVPTYYPSATRLDSATPLILQPGENREQIDIKIAAAPFHCVDGKISASGAPASASFAVQDIALAGTRLVRLRTGSGEDGKYHFCGLPAGSYRLFTDDAFTEFAVSSSDIQHVDLAVDPGHLKLRVDWEDPPLPKLSATSEAILRKFASLAGLGDAPSDDDLRQLAARFIPESPQDTELYNLAVRLSQTHEFTDQQIMDFARQLHPTTMVSVLLLGVTNGVTDQLAARIASETPFPNGIPTGDYTVQVQGFGSPAYSKEVTYNGSKLVGETLRVSPGADGTIHIVMAQGMATIAAKVIDADGKPVPHATIIVIPDSVTSVSLLSRDSLRGQTDQNADYTSPPLAPGKYRVLATTQSIRWGVPDDLEKVLLVLFQAKDVELDSKATVKIALEPVPM